MVLSGTIMFYIQSLADIIKILWDNGFISILSFFKYPNHTFIVKRNFHIIFFFLWLHVHFGEKPFAKRQ